MPKLEPVTVAIEAYVPELMRAATRVAAQPCEIGYPKKKDCRFHPEQPKREWCWPCTLRAAAAKDLKRLQKRRVEAFTGKRRG